MVAKIISMFRTAVHFCSTCQAIKGLFTGALPWVPKAFHARFPFSVKSKVTRASPLVSSACGRRNEAPRRTREKTCYPGYRSTVDRAGPVTRTNFWKFRLGIIWEISARFPRWEKAERGFLARNARKKANVAKHKNHNFRACHSFGNSHSCITAVKWDAYDVENTAGNARRCNPIKKFVKISSRAWLLTLFSLSRTPVRAISCGTRASMQSGTWANFNKLFNGI